MRLFKTLCYSGDLTDQGKWIFTTVGCYVSLQAPEAREFWGKVTKGYNNWERGVCLREGLFLWAFSTLQCHPNHCSFDHNPSDLPTAQGGAVPLLKTL